MSLASSSRLLPSAVPSPAPRRLFSTTASRALAAPAPPPASSEAALTERRKPPRPRVSSEGWEMKPFQFDDTTSAGWMRLERIREAVELVRKVELNRDVLRAQSTPFKPPAAPIRITQTIDLGNADLPLAQKRVLVAPVSSLPLTSPEAIHRFKLLAGPRWSPGPPGSRELDDNHPFEGYNAAASGDIGKEGWFKLSEDRFAKGRMNRKSASDTLEKLVEAANDPNSPLSTELPIDMRHLLARQRKKKQRAGQNVWQRAEALKARPQVVGGVRGFPIEWLGEGAKA